MQARLTLSAVLGLVLFVSLARTAQAGRVVYFEILCDDKIVLDVSLLDQGEAGFDAA